MIEHTHNQIVNSLLEMLTAAEIEKAAAEVTRIFAEHTSALISADLKKTPHRFTPKVWTQTECEQFANTVNPAIAPYRATAVYKPNGVAAYSTNTDTVKLYLPAMLQVGNDELKSVIDHEFRHMHQRSARSEVSRNDPPSYAGLKRDDPNWTGVYYSDKDEVDAYAYADAKTLCNVAKRDFLSLAQTLERGNTTGRYTANSGHKPELRQEYLQKLHGYVTEIWPTVYKD